MPHAYLLAGARTPMGKFLGQLRGVPAPQLGSIAIVESLRRAQVDAPQVDEVIMGCVLPAGMGQAPARQAALGAGLPHTVAALTINKVCGSGLKAVMLAAQAVRLGDADVIVAGGMESMSQAPYVAPFVRQGQRMGNVELVDSMIHDGLWCAFGDCHMGAHAESTAAKFRISREQQDAYAAESQRRAAAAQASGAFADELTPVVVAGRRGESVSIAHDEGPRPETTPESLAALKPVFQQDGTVTAGNASLISDGAAALVVTGEKTAAACPSPWKARIIASHTSGTAPSELFLAPVDAIRGVLHKAGLQAGDVELYEINEAFAAQSLACLQELGLDGARVNVHGGAIALGHPIGASGARLLVTLLSALKQREFKRGIASLCLGGGNAVAMLVEMC